jgi:hypothetical protein
MSMVDLGIGTAIPNLLGTTTAVLAWRALRHTRRTYRDELFERRAGNADLVFAVVAEQVDSVDIEYVLHAKGLDLPRGETRLLMDLMAAEGGNSAKTTLSAVRVEVHNRGPLPITDVIVELETPVGRLPKPCLSTSVYVLLPLETAEIDVFIAIPRDQINGPLYATPWFLDAFGGVWASPLKKPAMVMSFPQMTRAAHHWHQISRRLPGRRRYIIWSAARNARRREVESARQKSLLKRIDGETDEPKVPARNATRNAN